MIKQTQLSFKLGMTDDEITPRSMLSVHAEFLREFGIRDLIGKHMPLPGSNRRYRPILTAFKELPIIAYHRFRER